MLPAHAVREDEHVQPCIGQLWGNGEAFEVIADALISSALEHQREWRSRLSWKEEELRLSPRGIHDAGGLVPEIEGNPMPGIGKVNDVLEPPDETPKLVLAARFLDYGADLRFLDPCPGLLPAEHDVFAEPRKLREKGNLANGHIRRYLRHGHNLLSDGMGKIERALIPPALLRHCCLCPA